MFYKEIYKTTIYGFLSLFVFIFIISNEIFAQYSLTLTEDSLYAIPHKRKLSGGGMLIFKSSEQLNFDSSADNLTPPEYKNGLYFVQVPSGSQAFSVIFNDVPTYLNFGQQMDPNSLPALKEGEIKYYTVTIKSELEWSDITDNERKRGTFITPFGPNVSDALLVVRLFPSDLELEIKETNNLISKLEKEGSSYNVYIKMPTDKKIENYKLVFSSSETDDLIVTLPRFEPKSVKFIRIRKPIIETVTELETPVQTTNIKQNFGKNVIGYWAGSLGDNKTYMNFSQFDDVKNSVTGKIFLEGIYRDFKGMIRFKSIDEYQMSLYLAKDELFSNGAKIDLSYKSGVLNGLWLDDSGQIIDVSVMRSSYIQVDNSLEIREKINSVNVQLSGCWKPIIQNSIFDILVIERFNTNLESEIHFFKNGIKLNTIDSRLLKSSSSLSLIATNFKITGVDAALTFSMTLKGAEANSTLMSDNGEFIQNIKLETTDMIINEVVNIYKGKTDNASSPIIKKNIELFKVDDYYDGFTPLKSKATRGSVTIDNIMHGSRVEVLNKGNVWWRVKLEDGKVGFIHNSRLIAENELSVPPWVMEGIDKWLWEESIENGYIERPYLGD